MLGTEWGKPKATELVKKILSQQPLIVQGGTTVANALAGGQVSIAVGTYAYTIERLKKQGAAVDWIAVSPLPVLTSAEGVLKTAAHPNAGRFFAGWMGTPEGQKIRYATQGQAMRGNIRRRLFRARGRKRLRWELAWRWKKATMSFRLFEPVAR